MSRPTTEPTADHCIAGAATRSMSGTGARAAVAVLLVSGSTWDDSPHTRVLRWLHRHVWPGATTDLYDGLSHLPAFSPGVEDEPAEVRDLLDRVSSAQAVLFSTPQYVGAVPGALKNLLEWTMGGALSGKPVAWVEIAYPARPANERAQLPTLLATLGAQIVDSACARVDLVSVVPAVMAETEDRELAGVMSSMVAAVCR